MAALSNVFFVADLDLSIPLALRQSMRSEKSKFNFFHLVPILLVACAAQQRSTEPAAAPVAPSSQNAQAMLELSKSIDGDANADSCDKENADRKTKLLNIIAEIKIEAPADAVKFSGGWLKKLQKEERKSGTAYISWARTMKAYENFENGLKKSLEPRESYEFLSWLNSSVKNLLRSDQLRVKGNMNFAIHSENVAKIPELFEKVSTCFKSETCYEINWSTTQADAIAKVPLYQHFLDKLEEAKTSAEKRVVIKSLHKFIGRDQFFFVNSKSPQVKILSQSSPRIYSVQIDASSFSEDEKVFLKDTVESVWKNDQNQVKIEWVVQSEKAADPFKLFFHTDIGNRPYVFKREMHLYTDMPARGLAHEVGRALGLRDRQYMVWDTQRCQYAVQIDADDIMSSPESGEVTQEIWDELSRIYSEESAVAAQDSNADR